LADSAKVKRLVEEFHIKLVPVRRTEP
jgi:hypothetical protein